MVIAEIKRALLLIDHHLRWLEKNSDTATADKVNTMLQRMAHRSDKVYRICRTAECETCIAILEMYPEFDRSILHDWHKKETMRYEYQRTTKIIVANVK